MYFFSCQVYMVGCMVRNLCFSFMPTLQYIQSEKSKASPQHYFRDVFCVQISSDEQPVCNILLP